MRSIIRIIRRSVMWELAVKNTRVLKTNSVYVIAPSVLMVN